MLGLPATELSPALGIIAVLDRHPTWIVMKISIDPHVQSMRKHFSRQWMATMVENYKQCTSVMSSCAVSSKKLALLRFKNEDLNLAGGCTMVPSTMMQHSLVALFFHLTGAETSTLRQGAGQGNIITASKRPVYLNVNRILRCCFNWAIQSKADQKYLPVNHEPSTINYCI